MTVGLDYLKPYTDAVPSNSARRIENRRHGGWLLALERALLENKGTTGTSKHRQDDAPTHRDTGGSGEKAHLHVRNEMTSVSEAGILPAGADKNNVPVVDIAKTMSTRSEAADAQGDASRAPKMENGGEAMRMPDHDAPLPEEDRHPASVVVATPHPNAASYRAPIPLPAANPKEEFSLARPQETGALRTPPQRGTPGLAFVAAERSTDADRQVEAECSPAAQEAEAHQDSEAYQRRKLHLFHSEDGVHAWIRDVDVSEAGVQAIASALYAELATSGLKLAALTLNGRRLANLFPNERSDEDEQSASKNVSTASEAGMRSPQAMQQITDKGAY